MTSLFGVVNWLQVIHQYIHKHGVWEGNGGRRLRDHQFTWEELETGSVSGLFQITDNDRDVEITSPAQPVQQPTAQSRYFYNLIISVY